MGNREGHTWSLQEVRSADLRQMSLSELGLHPKAREAFASKAKPSVTSVCHHTVMFHHLTVSKHPSLPKVVAPNILPFAHFLLDILPALPQHEPYLVLQQEGTPVVS